MSGVFEVIHRQVKVLCGQHINNVRQAFSCAISETRIRMY